MRKLETVPTNEERMALEMLVDRISLSAVLATLGGICEDKADHIAQSYSDEELAERWRLCAAKLEIASTHIVELIG